MTATPVRHPAVAGRFYPGDAEVLREEVRTYLSQPSPHKPIRALGCIVTACGLRLFRPRCRGSLCRIGCSRTLHRNVSQPHRHRTHPGDYERRVWETPLGHVPIDSNSPPSLSSAARSCTKTPRHTSTSMPSRLSCPFCKCASLNSSSFPSRSEPAQFEPLRAAGDAIADVIAAQNDPILIVASSDMNHYESDAITRIKDQSAIEPILTLDARALYEVVIQQNISMCGFGPP